MFTLSRYNIVKADVNYAPPHTYIKTEQTNDKALMARSRDGDSQAFALLMYCYARPLYGYLYRMLRNSADAEDVFQETFLRMYSNMHRFRVDGRFTPWVYRMATFQREPVFSAPSSHFVPILYMDGHVAFVPVDKAPSNIQAMLQLLPDEHEPKDGDKQPR